MEVIGVKFGEAPKTHLYEAGQFEYEIGCGVVVETERGLEYGRCVQLPQTMADGEHKNIKPVVRRATERDDETYAANCEKIPHFKERTRELIEKANLDMRIVDILYTFDCEKLIVYFTAEARVDFRGLVRDMAREFRTRIELRQIGARDECRMKGGIAPCGRACCCSDHMSDIGRVSIRMAKNQGLALNPGKISGLCGRLMCCLAYENEHYAETNKRMPKPNAAVTVADGETGVCIGINPLKETVRVKFDTGSGIRIDEYPVTECTFAARGERPEQTNDKKNKGGKHKGKKREEPADDDTFQEDDTFRDLE